MATTVDAILTATLDNFTAGTMVVDSGTAGTQRTFQVNPQNIETKLIPGEVYACHSDSQNGDPFLILVGKCPLTIKTSIAVVNGRYKKTFSR